MANELVHKTVGPILTQTEWEAVGAHVFNSQAAGDIAYASSNTQLSRLAKGSDNDVLHLASGLPAWSATLAGLTLTTPVIATLYQDAGKTKLITFPASSQTLVGRTTTDTLTNKTLTAPTLNGTTTLGSTPIFDAGSGDAKITTTGSLNGLVLEGSNTNHGLALIFRHLDATPSNTKVIGLLYFYGYDGAGVPDFEYGSVAVRYTNVSDGSEESELRWSLAVSGGTNLAMTLSGAGELAVDAACTAGTATVGQFDEYDDAMILRQGISGQALEKLEEVGVMSHKDAGSGWMVNVQPMMYLCAGGIYQNRAKIDGLDDRLTKMELALPQGAK